MKKFFVLFIFLYIGVTCFSQTLKKQLLGSWVKLKTETMDGRDTCGNYGLSGDYLRITFSKSKMMFARTPWDKGDEIMYNMKDSTIVTAMNGLNYVFQETYYDIEKINSTDLILKTTFKGKDIRYYLKNQNCYSSTPINGLYQFDNDTILIIRKPNPHSKGDYFRECYSFSSVADRFMPARPIFNSDMFFHEYLGFKMNLDETMQKDKLSAPIQISFLIDYKGIVSDVQLLSHYKDSYDKSIYDLVCSTSKKWRPTIIGDPVTKVKMIYTILLIDLTK